MAAQIGVIILFASSWARYRESTATFNPQPELTFALALVPNRAELAELMDMARDVIEIPRSAPN